MAAIESAREQRANIESLRELAIWLEGLKKGQNGSLYPLGTIVLEDLWKVIREVREFREYRVNNKPTLTYTKPEPPNPIPMRDNEC